MWVEPRIVVPAVGAKVRCFFGANHYLGKVVRITKRGNPVVRFTIKNGKVKEGRASVYTRNAIQVRDYKGYLAEVTLHTPEVI